ncbi:hypothetical protein BDV95DRAFT_218424 [Massariosphaeria phaeospora]|uniref:Uncharacterized protein n=1 Tax=Massariosphaeria phaeospora TaxID=100035 RepID=A0A7C8MBF1_9PLEO|nr:hypothetical protein BDV95DRAFT_218424 [Massariosphaeria phaeospora]
MVLVCAHLAPEFAQSLRSNGPLHEELSIASSEYPEPQIPYRLIYFRCRHTPCSQAEDVLLLVDSAIPKRLQPTPRTRSIRPRPSTFSRSLSAARSPSPVPLISTQLCEGTGIAFSAIREMTAAVDRCAQVVPQIASQLPAPGAQPACLRCILCN